MVHASLWPMCSYVDPHGHVITSRRKITMKYLRTYFVIDVVSLLPFDLILQGNSAAKVGKNQFDVPRQCDQLLQAERESVHGVEGEVGIMLERGFCVCCTQCEPTLGRCQVLLAKGKGRGLCTRAAITTTTTTTTTHLWLLWKHVGAGGAPGSSPASPPPASTGEAVQVCMVTGRGAA